jgi:gliding motility-associated-like protein
LNIASSQIPVEFIPNKGQWESDFKYLTQIPQGYLFFEENGFTYLLRNQRQWSEYMMNRHESAYTFRDTVRIEEHALRMRFIQANPDAFLLGQNPTEHYYNYFFTRAHVSEVHPHNLLIYNEVYTGVDLVVDGRAGTIKYDWVVFPGADANQIQIEIQGANDIVLHDGHLIIHTSLKEILESPPIAFQPADLGLNASYDTVPCRFELNGNTLSYVFPDGYDSTRKLIIDPELIFATYSGARGDNFGFTATYDSKSNLYAGGNTNGAQGPYPVTTGAFQTTYGGSGPGRAPVNLPCDVSISKYDSAGNNLLWASYIGGSDDEFAHSLVVDANDDLYVLGTTYSDDFPTTSNAFDESFNDTANLTDIYVARISEDGKTLKACTYIGGKERDGLNNASLSVNYADEFRGDIIPDNLGNIYIASCTESQDFPLVNAFDSQLDRMDGVILSLTPDLSTLRWSSFLGGKQMDALYSIKVDEDSLIYVGGGSNSNDIPKTDSAYMNSKNGGIDGFVAQLDRKNFTLNKASYFGTSAYDQVYFIDYDFQGNLYLAGQTEGNIAPSSPSIYGESNKGQFVAKMDTNLTNLQWQTSFGAGDNLLNLSPSAFLVDNCEHIYYSGWGRFETGSTTNGLETTEDAISRITDGRDFYIAVLNKNAEGLLYATFFGGDSSHDHVDGGTSRFDKRGVVYQSVCSSCPDFQGAPGFQDFPVTPNAVFTSNVSPRCSNASLKIDLQIRSAVIADFTPSPIRGCLPLNVTIQNRSTIVDKFYWDFGDGRPLDSINFSPTITYTEPGEYTITLTVVDSNSCNISDEFKRKITVLGSSEAAFSYSIEPCSYKVLFKNESESESFIWKFSDGTTSTEKNPEREYQPNDRDVVWLITDPGTICQDSISENIEIAGDLESEYTLPNFFSPNDDGFNDEFCLEGFVANCDTLEWFVYNRWGERLFYSTNILDCWSGKIPNTDVTYPQGTYFAIYRIKERESNKWFTVSGQIALVK